jgi:hypothetical protein
MAASVSSPVVLSQQPVAVAAGASGASSVVVVEDASDAVRTAATVITTPKSSSVSVEVRSNGSCGSQMTPQPTVIRLKRRVEDSPSQVLLMSYKRRKTDGDVDDVDVVGKGDDNDSLCTSVFRLAGTVGADEVRKKGSCVCVLFNYNYGDIVR